MELGVEGMSPTALSAGIITGGVFVMGLVVAGTLGDYRDAARAHRPCLGPLLDIA